MANTANIIGPKQQLYADPHPAPDEVTFRQDNTSAAYFSSPYYLAHQNQVQAIPRRWSNAPLSLADFVPHAVIAAVQGAGKISFHAAGDTGAAKVNKSQTAATALAHQAHVADAMANDVNSQGITGPAFAYILGDVIYNFGEAQYYYDQFYEPYRRYDRPIFAIPGNHDAMVFGPTSTAPKNPSLAAFLGNFCATTPGPSSDAMGIMRSVMTQPGVYFTLDAPFVSIIGLYSNALEGPGVISSQGGRYPVSDEQLTFLQSELSRLKSARQANERAIVVAVHHPPLSIDAVHGGSTGLQTDLDRCFQSAGMWPDLVLSGHAHLYQRFTHVTAAGKQTPYIVAGNGGFAATPPVAKPPPAGTTIGPDTLVVAPIVEFGYLTISASKTTLSAVFQECMGPGVTVADSVTVDLQSGKLVSGPATQKLLPKGAPKAPQAPKSAPTARAGRGRTGSRRPAPRKSAKRKR